MPRTKQLQLKRQWAQAKNHIEKAVIEVIALQEIFKPTHPEYAKLCEYVLTALFVALQGWDAFCKHAWGKIPESTEGWRS